MANGDTVIFEDGTYDIDGPIVIRHTDLTISSDDGDGVLIRSLDNKGLVFRNHGDVSGLEIRGFSMASAETTRLAPARNFAMVFIEDTAGLDDIKILDNTFRGDKQNGVRIGSSDQSSLFTNVEIRDNTFETIPDDRYPVHTSNTEVTLFANSFERSNYVHRDGDGSLIDLYNIYPGKPDRAPVVTPPPAVELEATGPQTVVTPEQLGTATARDDRDQSPVISNDSPGSFTVGNHTVTWTATDNTGNSGTAAQRVTIRDTTPPVITLTGDIKVTVEMGVTHEEMLAAVAATCTDLVDGDLLITSNGVVDTDTPGEYVVEQSCTDAAGNPASVTRTVTVVSTQPVQQPSDLGIVSSYDMGNGWRMMTINWTEPAQPPVSGYEVTVTGSNGTLLPLSQFEIMAPYNYRGNGSYSPYMAVYKMDGYRNPQDDYDLPRSGEIDIHDNIMYGLGGPSYWLYDLNGTHIPRVSGEYVVRDDKIWSFVDDAHEILAHDRYTGNLTDRVDLYAGNPEGAIFTELNGILYVVGSSERSDAYVYKTDGTYLPDKSFDIEGSILWGMDAEERTGTLWIPLYEEATRTLSVAVYATNPDSAPSHMFSIPAALQSFALTTPVVSETIAVPTGTNSTAYYHVIGKDWFDLREPISLTNSVVYYYHALANETVTHTVRSVGPSEDPPATMTTRGDMVIPPPPPPVTVFSNTFDTDLGTWTYQERPYGSLNSMFCDDDITGTYTLAHSADNGGSAHVARANVTDMCWFGSAGLARTFDVPAGYGGGDLTVTLGYQSQAGVSTSLIEIICVILFDICAGDQNRLGAQGAATDMANATAQTGQILGRHANNLFYAVTDSADNDLANGQLFPGDRSVPKVGASWNTATITVPSLDVAACPCEIEVYTTDLDWDVFNKRFHIDNVNATMTRP